MKELSRLLFLGMVAAPLAQAGHKILWTKDGASLGEEASLQAPPLVFSAPEQCIFFVCPTLTGDGFQVRTQSVDKRAGRLAGQNGHIISSSGIPFWPNPAASMGNSGDLMVGWQDTRETGMEIRVQRISRLGKVIWQGASGVAVAKASHLSDPVICSDGSEGAIVAWISDALSEAGDIFVQRVDRQGNIMWGERGLIVSSAPGSQFLPAICEDGKGGAYIAWVSDEKDEGDIYLQRVDSMGKLAWKDGLVVAGAKGQQLSPQLLQNGSGEVIIFWVDWRNGSDSDIYAQRVSAQGKPLWQKDGVAICDSPGIQKNKSAVSDGKGGAVIVWADRRDPASEDDIYAQHISPEGTLLWQAGGVAVVSHKGDQDSPSISGDLSNGWLIAWEDDRAGETQDIYCQQLKPDGQIGWDRDGVPLCTAPGHQTDPRIASAGERDFLILWRDSREGAGVLRPFGQLLRVE